MRNQQFLLALLAELQPDRKGRVLPRLAAYVASVAKNHANTDQHAVVESFIGLLATAAELETEQQRQAWREAIQLAQYQSDRTADA